MTDDTANQLTDDAPAQPKLSWRERKKAKREAQKARLAAMPKGKRALYELWSWVSSLLIAVAVLYPIRVMLIDWNDIPSGSMLPTLIIGDRIAVNKINYGLRVPLPKSTSWIANWDAPDRGDIVIFSKPVNTGPKPHQQDKGITMVKRVMGVPGDTLQMVDNRLIVNGEPLEYEVLERKIAVKMDNGLEEVNVLKESVPTSDGETVEHIIYQAAPSRGAVNPQLASFRKAIHNWGPVTLGDDQFWMMGDNRDFSQDSRVFYLKEGAFVTLNQIYGSSGRIAISFDRLEGWAPQFSRFFQPSDKPATQEYAPKE